MAPASRKAFVKGRYRKLVRGVPQSPWFAGTGAAGTGKAKRQRVGHRSVEEVICEPLCEFLGAKKGRLHASGREDMDVRMLGNGRPFVIEVEFPKPKAPREPSTAMDGDESRAAGRDGGGIASSGLGAENGEDGEAGKLACQKDLEDREAAAPADAGESPGGLAEVVFADAQAFVNDHSGGIVEVIDLAAATPEDFAGLQALAELKRKSYVCLCWSRRAVARQELLDLAEGARAGILVNQRTPVRVLQRRSNLQRPRWVGGLSFDWLNPHWFFMRIQTEAGTYVKEFVHGDWGRTQPSLASLLKTRTDIIQLDVVEVLDRPESPLGGSGTKEAPSIAHGTKLRPPEEAAPS